MKKLSRISVLLLFALLLGVQKSDAQIDIIGDLVKRAIKAVDLEVQRIQNKTIWLQEAQKTLENSMSQLHLNEITDWAQKQKDLYAGYYNELWEVKSTITYYHRIKEISQKQVQLVQSYSRTWNMLKQDKHFTATELDYMGKVYGGILDATVDNVDRLFAIVNSFSTQMSDAKRLDIINNVGKDVDENYNDLLQFNTQNSMLSLQRAKDGNEAEMIKQMYGII